MRRAILLSVLMVGCAAKPDLGTGRDAILYQADPTRGEVVIDSDEDESGSAPPAGVILAPVGTRVTIIGPAPQMVGMAEPWFLVTVRDGKHRGVVGSVAKRFLRPSD